MNNTENQSSTDSTARATSTNGSSRNTGISLVETRRSNRTLGCVGLSVCVHVAFLAALAIAPDSIRNIGGGDGREAGAGGSVSMIESSNVGGDIAQASADATSTPVEVSVMTDSSSDIVMSPVKAEPLPEKLTEKLPEKKVVVEPKVQPVAPLIAKKTPKTEKTAPQESAKPVTAAPVIAATPVLAEDNGVPVEEAPTQVPDEPVHETIAAAPVEQSKPVEEVAPEKIEQPVAKVVAEPVAKAASAEANNGQAEEGQDDPAPVLLANPPGDGGSSDTQEEASTSQGSGAQQVAQAAGQGGDQSGEGGQYTGGAGTVIGPIRDASELRALPGNPNPVYPARDRLARKEGTTVILGRVSADGRVTDLKLEKSSGSPAMDSASIQAFRSWRFQGGQQGWIRKPFQFRLVGEAKEVPAPLGKTMKR